MPTSTTAVTGDGEDRNPQVTRPRDAVSTRHALLHSARRRFALNGYAATTVREIASDAGVNVSLINRYFESKEGLFEACLTNAATELERTAGPTLDDVVATVIDRVTSPLSDDGMLQLLLLLRSSGDERADDIRRDTLRSFAEKVAEVEGWRPGDASSEHVLLRAEIAICTGLGIALIRSTTGLEPLASATSAELAAPIGDLFSVLLSRDR